MLNSDSTPANALHLISESLRFIELARTKKLVRKEREDWATYLREIPRVCEVFLTNKGSLRSFIRYVDEALSHTGQEREFVSDSVIQTFRSMRFPVIDLKGDDDHLPDDIKENLVMIASCLLEKVNQKPARTNRISSLRRDLWNILTWLSEEIPCRLVLSAAQMVAVSEKHKEAERYGATLCLLELWRDGDSKTNEILNSIRSSTSNKDVKFAILDHEVRFKGLDEMSALMELEDFEERSPP